MAFIGKITDTDGVTGLIGSTLYGTCDTAAATVAKVGTLSDFDTLMTGVTIHIKFTYSNTATDPTLNVNGTGAKRIYKAGTTSVGTTVASSWAAGSVISLTYDGSGWIMNDHTDDNNSVTGVKGNAESNYRTGNVNLTPVNIGAADANHTHSDYVLKTGDTMSGNLTFAVADGSDTPGIVFKRGNFTDSTLDWKIYNSSGALMMDRTVAGDTETWQNKFKVDGTGIWYAGTQVSLVGHTHNYAGSTTAGGAATNIATTVTNGVSSGSTYYGVIFTADPDTSGGYPARKNNDFKYGHVNGTTSSIGYAEIVLGNSKDSATDGNKRGVLTLFSKGTSYHSIETTETSTYVKHTLPAKTGTILNSGTTSFTQVLSSGTKIGTIKINDVSTDIYCQTNTNTDTKVTQSQTTTEEFRPVLFGATHNTNPESLEGTITDASYVTKRIFAQPATGNLYLYSTSGDSPALVFRRGTMTDNYNDWKIYNSGGHLYFAMSTANASSETWTNKVYINGSTGKLYVGGTAVSVEGHTHPYVPFRHNTDTYTEIASYYSGGTNPAYIRITFPTSTRTAWTMVNMKLFVRKLYSTDVGGTITINCHHANNADWNSNSNAYCDANLSDIDIYGSDGNIIYIKGIGDYTNISIEKLMIGDSARTVDFSTTTIDYVSSLPETYQTFTVGYYLPSTTTYAGSTTIGGAATNVNITDLNANADAAIYYPTFVSGNGSQALKTNTINGPRFRHEPGTTSAVGVGRIMLGNATTSGTAGNAKGQIAFYSESSGYAMLEYATSTANSTFQFPAKASGTYTLAVTSDIPTTYAGSTTAGGIANQAHYLTNERLVSTSMTYGSEKFEWYDLSANQGNDPTKKQNPENDWFHHTTMHHKNNAGYYFDMAYGFHTNAIYYRRVQNGADKGWVRLIDSSNIGSQTVSSAATLSTPRNISLGTGIASTATAFDGSADITIPVTGIKEAYLTWGGKDYSSSYGPLDAALTPRLGANRMEFARASGITVERSTDSGSTWADAGLTNVQKVGLFTTPGQVIAVSATSTAGTGTEAAKNMMRVTVATSAAMIYTSLNKFIIFMSTDGASNCYVKIRARLQKNVSAGNDTWIIWNKTSKAWVSTTDASATDTNTRCSLSGWTGFNVINVSPIITYGNNVDVQYGNIQFIFGCTTNTSTSAGMKVISIQGYGGVGWTTPSTMALTGHLYSYDSSQNATFPAVVIASNGGFRGNLNGTATNATNIATTVTNGVTTEPTNYGVIFAANPNTSENNAARKTNDVRIQLQQGTASALGWASLILGNTTASGTADNKEGRIVLYSPGTSYHKIIGASTSSSIDHTLPNISGTFMMLTKASTNYWGMSTGENTTDWVRTTSSGLIPFQSGGLSDPHSSIGTSSWAFSAAYIKDIYSTTLREGGTALTDKYVKQAGDTMTGNLTIATSAFGPLIIQRTDNSPLAAGIFFKNKNGVLGAIGMTETVDSGLYRWNAATTTRYKILDTSNTSFSQTVTSGTEIGRITIGGTEQIIYSNSSPVSTGTANKLAYYSNANTIASTPQVGYYEIDSTASTPVKRDILDIRGTAVGNDTPKLISGTVGLLSYGDGGPQINFGTAASMTTANAQEGALIFTDHDSAAAGVSWHFVSNQSDWNVISKRFHARTSISIGTDLPVTSHALYVNGSGYMNGVLTLYREGTTSQDNPSGIIFTNKDTTTGQSTSTGTYIYAYSDHLSTTYGSNMVIQPCGSLFIGGGEAANQHYTTIKSNIGSSEHIYLTADGCVYLQANASTIANRIGFVNDNGDIVPCKADTKTNNIGSIGTSTYKWGAMYATKFYGPLEGNASTSSRTGIRWNAVSQGQKWSRFFYSVPTNSTVGSSCILTIDCTRGSVVVNASFLITASHAASGMAKCIQIASNNYTPIKVRLVADGSGDYYFEVYDTAQSIASGTTQTWHCCLITLGNANITTYTAFTDGTTVPTNFTAMNEFTTTTGSATVAIKNISRTGTTFTATRQDGSTFTFTQQDTTYTHPSYDSHELGLYKIEVDSLGHVSNVEATGPYLGAKTDNSYWGMTTPGNDDTQWIRTSQLGIIPYKARSASATSTATGDACKLGTEYWYFAESFIQYMHGTAEKAETADRLINNSSVTTTTGVQYTSGGKTIGTADGNAAEGSNASYKLWSYPADGTYVSGGVANIQNLRLYWSSAYFRDIFASPNYKDLYHRAVVNGTAYAWRKIIDSTNYTDYTVTKTGTGASGTWGINITGSAATLSAKTLTAETLGTTDGSFVFKGDNLFGGVNDWVGFQADAGNDRFQIVANNQLMFRQKDDTWGSWVGSLTPNHVSATSGLKVTKTTTTIGTGTSAFSYDSGVKIEHDVTTSTDTTSTVSPTHGGTFTTVDSVTRDSYGHVTKINTKTVTLPNDQNTDTKVTQSETTTTDFRPIVLGRHNTTTVSELATTETDQVYTSTKFYAKPSTGVLYVTALQALSTVCANTANSNSAGGIALYGTDPAAYGIMFRGTANSGKHGYVQSDWATYFTMNEGGTTRGWVFRRQTTGPVASVSGEGHAVFNGSVTVGGNTTNTSGCRMVYTSSTQTLDFVFA